MRYKVKKFDPLSTSKIIALLYAPFGLIHTFIGLILLSNENPKDDGAAVFLLLMPLVLLGATFVMTLIWTVWYNWLASKVGGMEIDLEE